MTTGTRRKLPATCHFCKEKSFFTMVIGDIEVVEENGIPTKQTETKTLVNFCSDHTQYALETWYYNNLIE